MKCHDRPTVGLRQRGARLTNRAGFGAILDAARVRMGVVRHLDVNALALEPVEHRVLRAAGRNSMPALSNGWRRVQMSGCRSTVIGQCPRTIHSEDYGA